MSVLDIDNNIRNDDYVVFDRLFKCDTFGDTLNNIYNIYKNGYNQSMNQNCYIVIYSGMRGVSICGPEETINIGYISPVCHDYFDIQLSNETINDIMSSTYPRIILKREITLDLYKKLLYKIK